MVSQLGAVAAFAAIVLASCHTNDIVREAESVDPLAEETEFAQYPGQLMAGTSELVQSSCSGKEVRCADGTCALQCTDTSPFSQYRYQEQVLKTPRDLPPPPNIAAAPSVFQQKAAAFKSIEDAASLNAMTHAEVAQGLADAAQDSKAAEQQEKTSALKAKVNVEFNRAAAKGGMYKQAAMKDDRAILRVKQMRLALEEQKKEQKAAEKAFEAAKARTEAAQHAVEKSEELQHRTKYEAEYAGQQYQDAKKEAILDDNSLKETEREQAQEMKFRQVARQAVVAEALREASANAAARGLTEPAATPAPPVAPATTAPVKQQAAAPVPVVAPAAPAAAVTVGAKSCSDCKLLPDQYSAKGGTCADCRTWAADGQCRHPSFRAFMSHFCAASCDCPDKKTPVSEMALLQLSMPTTTVQPLY